MEFFWWLLKILLWKTFRIFMSWFRLEEKIQKPQSLSHEPQKCT
jgi:hypothetical protein